ncbi:MAG: hypothetical protein ACRERE_40375, partial [Candidatus Entotheonellia bacterium]
MIVSTRVIVEWVRSKMMPGLVGIVRIDAESASVAPMLQKLSHFASYGSKEITLGAGVSLGVIYRKDRPSEF